MDEMKLNDTLKTTLHACADDLHAPAQLKTRIDFALQAAPAKKRGLRSWKRMTVAACAALAILVTGAVASTSLAGLYSHSWNNQHMSYAETTEKAGVTLPETFANGFAFESGHEVQTEAHGMTGAVESAWTDVNAVYTKDGVKLDLETGAPQAALTENPIAVPYEVNGVTVQYVEAQYLFIPADYELTDEQAQAEREGKIIVSTGSDEVESNVHQHLSWEKDGVRFSLSGFDTGLSADEMLAMAGEIIGA